MPHPEVTDRIDDPAGVGVDGPPEVQVDDHTHRGGEVLGLLGSDAGQARAVSLLLVEAPTAATTPGQRDRDAEGGGALEHRATVEIGEEEVTHVHKDK